ncbi:calcium-binding protein [Lutimaribacter marinistellae]|uniref:Calcium-binding protein n=1 Tax=Lutimaribacter marinistellae TaxID=1820329 RepID=A0ABV7TFF9_9RHOB
MTKYVLSGFRVDRNLADDVVAVEPTTFTIITASADPQTFTYTITVPPSGDELLPGVDLNRAAPDVTMLAGFDDIDDISSTELGQIIWTGGVTQILAFTYNPPSTPAQDWIFAIGGTPLPNVSSPAEFAALEAQITGGGAITSGPLAPGTSISLNSLSGVQVLPGELVIGTPGADTLIGSAGDDVLQPIDNDDYDLIQPGAGNDTVDLTEMNMGYAEIDHRDLNAPIGVNLDGTSDTGVIDKGANGQTTLMGLSTAINAGGLGIVGTNGNDTFRVDTGDGFMNVTGLGGNDVFDFRDIDNKPRLDYALWSLTGSSGITANLVTGTIADPFGGTDSILGSVRELRGSDLSDSILGSDANERFILRRGNDTLDAGGGIDVLRYDRSRVEAVEVDLEAGTASGVWRGSAFTHQVSNVENLRGSQGDNDLLRGSSIANEILGGGGNDTIEGRAGDDTLVGEAGDDRIDGGEGIDQAAYWGMQRADALISQNADGTIRVESSQGTDQLVNIEQISFDDQMVQVSDLFPPSGPIIGTVGDDDLVGTVGDDFIDPLDNTGGDLITPSTGNDTVTFENAANGYFELKHDDLASGITVNIDGRAATGNIDKGAGGTTTLLFVDRAMNADGLAVVGSDFDDVFNLKPSDDGFVQVIGLGGNDTFNIDPDAPTNRLDYSWAGMSGITADLSAGTVSEDGFGGTDTINGSVRELRATDLNDSILGSDANERFILRRGNDTLDAGGGVDAVRYDRTGVESVQVDLSAGTATGVWRGDTFSHLLSNVENINGSREDDDLLRGDGRNNFINGVGGNDTLEGLGGEDVLIGGAGNDSMNGGAGLDRAEFWGVMQADATVTQNADGSVQVVSALGTDTLVDIEELGFDDASVRVADLFPQPGVQVGGNGDERLDGSDDAEQVIAGGGNDEVNGGGGDDSIDGGTGNDTLRGGDGEDVINGGDGNDTVNAGDGNDEVLGGDSPDDLRDVIYGGDGDDLLNGGYGNDQIFGQGGNDTIAGGFGADELQGQEDDDVVTGGALSDLVFGGGGNDFVNGGFGYDRINGGDGADRFFHLGVFDHGSDWVQDYDAAEGDVLVFGQAATADQFQINLAHTATPDGERSGEDDVQEAFVIYRPTGQIMWALVDGEGQSSINVQAGGELFDLLA